MTTTTPQAVSPSEAELLAALRTLRTENPTLGQTKLHALLLKTYSTWAVSEKRCRRVIHVNGLTAVKAGGDGGAVDSGDPAETQTSEHDAEGKRAKVYPTYRISEGLDITKWTKKVEVRYFGKRKGKGLVATERIDTGETVWKEGVVLPLVFMQHIPKQPFNRSLGVSPRMGNLLLPTSICFMRTLLHYNNQKHLDSLLSSPTMSSPILQ